MAWFRVRPDVRLAVIVVAAPDSETAAEPVRGFAATDPAGKAQVLSHRAVLAGHLDLAWVLVVTDRSTVAMDRAAATTVMVTVGSAAAAMAIVVAAVVWMAATAAVFAADFAEVIAECLARERAAVLAGAAGSEPVVAFAVGAVLLVPAMVARVLAFPLAESVRLVKQPKDSARLELMVRWKARAMDSRSPVDAARWMKAAQSAVVAMRAVPVHRRPVAALLSPARSDPASAAQSAAARESAPCRGPVVAHDLLRVRVPAVAVRVHRLRAGH